MSEHRSTINWKRETHNFAYESYNRDHDWRFDAGFSGDKQPNAEELTRLHEQAHHACFIASSVKTEDVVEPQ